MGTTSDRYNVSYITDPARFYEVHKTRLNKIGGSAFAQPAEEFGKQVAERFGKAEIAQCMRDGRELVGFALYKLIQGHLWRPYFVC